MALAYILASVSYGLLCAVCSLILGGSAWNALVVYLIAGLFAMITLVGRALIRARSDIRSTRG